MHPPSSLRLIYHRHAGDTSPAVLQHAAAVADLLVPSRLPHILPAATETAGGGGGAGVSGGGDPVAVSAGEREPPGGTPTTAAAA